jgi:stalled ribosome rescue protein Dom34
MSQKNKKQFGVWMDSQHATIIGREQVDTGDFVVLAHAKNSGQGSNSNENAANNASQTLQQKFFREITSHMQNVDEIHVTGTGKEQEQFIKYLADTPQFKNAIAKETTATKMSDEKLVEYIAGKFN